MRHLVLLLSIISIVLMASCSNNDNSAAQPDYGKLIIGKWRTADSTYFERYYSDGTGKQWDLKDDVQEDEAVPFRWEMDTEEPTRFMQWIQTSVGIEVPQACIILELTDNTFKYNNEGFRAEYSLIRAE